VFPVTQVFFAFCKVAGAGGGVGTLNRGLVSKLVAGLAAGFDEIQPQRRQ
jgi:hypothetical protein